MAKEKVAEIKLQIPAGQANPAPPVGTALGPRGVNIMAFCKEFNAATQKQAGDILPVVITVYKDKSFTFITKSPPAAVLLKKAANIAAGSKTKPPSASSPAPPAKWVSKSQIDWKSGILPDSAGRLPAGRLRPTRQARCLSAEISWQLIFRTAAHRDFLLRTPTAAARSARYHFSRRNRGMPGD